MTQRPIGGAGEGRGLSPVAAVLLAAMVVAGVLVVGETQGLWKLPSERTSPAVYALMGVGAVALAAALASAGRLIGQLGRPRYWGLIAILAVWLALSVGATVGGWNLLPASG